jgi:hypothetical protein
MAIRKEVQPIMSRPWRCYSSKILKSRKYSRATGATLPSGRSAPSSCISHYNILRGTVPYCTNTKAFEQWRAHEHTVERKIRYYYRFISIIPIGASEGTQLFDVRGQKSRVYDTRGAHNKIIVKQSYLLLTWLAYLRGELTAKKREEGEVTLSVKGFFIKPVRTTKFTTQKAPMAHKTFSQEQWLYKHYRLSLFFEPDTSYLWSYERLGSVNAAIYVGLLFRQTNYCFTTNLINVSRVTHRYLSSDGGYMSTWR